MNIGQQLRLARRKKGVTQKELGRHLGLSESIISYFETGERIISPQNIQKIENILGVKFRGENTPILFENDAEKLYKILKILFATPDNIKQMEEIWNDNKLEICK